MQIRHGARAHVAFGPAGSLPANELAESKPISISPRPRVASTSSAGGLAGRGPQISAVFDDLLTGDRIVLHPMSYLHPMRMFVMIENVKKGATHESLTVIFSLVAICLSVLVIGCSESPGESGMDVGDDSGAVENGDTAVQSDTRDVEDIGTTPGDTGEPDTGEPDTGEPDTGEPDTGEPGNSTNCDDLTLLGDLPDWSEATDVIDGRDPDPSQYTEVFMGDEFPGTSNSVMFVLPKGEYVAMEFTVPTDLQVDQGAWNLAPVTHSVETYGGGLMLISISECPGDVDPENFDDSACIRIYESVEGKHVTRWSLDSESNRCVLEPGETYFMNVIYVDSVELTFPPGQHDCGGATNCANYFQPMAGG